MIRISVSRSIPENSFTRICTIAIKFNTSAAVAFASFIMKPECLGETRAPPHAKFEQPDASMSLPA